MLDTFQVGLLWIFFTRGFLMAAVSIKQIDLHFRLKIKVYYCVIGELKAETKRGLIKWSRHIR